MSAVDERSVVVLDHPDARPHDAGELEHRHARRERVRGERRAEVVDLARLRNARCLYCWCPLAFTEAVDHDPSAARCSSGEPKFFPIDNFVK